MPYEKLDAVFQQAEQYYWHGQFQEALQLLEQLDTQDEVTELEQLQGQLLRCRIFTYQDMKKAQELANRIIQESQALDQPLIAVDTLFVLAEA